MRIRYVTLAVGLLLAASSGGLLLSASIGIIAGSAEFRIPYPYGHLIPGRFYSLPPPVHPLDMNQVADFWAVLGFFVIFASIGGLGSLLLGREFARPVILGVISSVALVSLVSWWTVLSVFVRYSYYSIPGIFAILPFASLFLAISSAIAMTVYIIQSRVPRPSESSRL